MISKFSTSKATAKTTAMKRRRTAAEKIAANYAKVRAGLLLRSQQKAAANSNSIPVGNSSLRYYPHFKAAGVPKHIFYYIEDGWKEFSRDVYGAIKEDLLKKIPIIEVKTKGVQYVLDFVHMYCLNLTTSDLVPMGWTDEADNCFFPSMRRKQKRPLKKRERSHRAVNVRLGTYNKETTTKTTDSNLGGLQNKGELGKCVMATAPTEVPPPDPSVDPHVHRRNIRQHRSPCLPFEVLLPLLALEIPAFDMQRINFYYELFQAGNMTRQAFVARVRLIAGDELLRRVILTFSPLVAGR